MNTKTVLYLMVLLAITVGGAGVSASAALPVLNVSAASTPRPPILSPLADNPNPPTGTVKLIFVHHSCGENWLEDGNGGLGIALRDNSYFVSDTNYEWGPDDIGDNTDIGHWWTWFRGPRSATYLSALYAESGQHSWYTRLGTDPGGENQVIMFKSCYPNSELQGSISDPIPAIGDNPLREQESGSDYHTISNAKGIYLDLLNYFATRQDKLFVVITAPPVIDNEYAGNARAFNTWLVEDWLAGYSHNNVAVWDFYNVLTSNGGDPDTNDLGQQSGNHHRWNAAAQTVEYITNQGGNTAAYPTDDPHPSAAGNQKATGEFVPLLNVFYHRWKGAAPPPKPGDHWVYLPIILREWSAPTPESPPSGDTTTDLIQPSDLAYRGAFRLPPGPADEGWEWSNWSSALTHYPDGDPSGSGDGYPGSLFGTGHDWYQDVAEVNIPVPVISAPKDVNDLNTATMLQDFADIRDDMFGYMEMPRVGLAYLPAQGGQTAAKLYFAWAPHLDEGATNPSHGWCELDLSTPQPGGAWRVGEYWNYVTGDYLFDIPPPWADSYVSGRYLATGRFRDGGQGAQGPSLFAIAPWAEGNPPPPGATLPATPLLLYAAVTDAEQHVLNGYHHSDEWTGGAWLTAGDRSAVVFVGTKGTGACWYGDPEGPCLDCEDRGWWSTGFIGQFLFYDPADLAAVAQGKKEPWEPQPYATLDVDDELYHLESTQQKYHVGAMAFDRAQGLLYVLEPLADEDRPLVHVWEVGD